MNYALTNGIILDGSRDMAPVTGKTVYVKDGKIERIEDTGMNQSAGGATNANQPTSGNQSAGDAPQPTGDYTTIDLGGKYLLPGLINLHVHIPGNGNPKKKASDAKSRVKLITSNGLLRAVGKTLLASYAKMELLSGTTTIRAVGGILNWDSDLRDRINAGKTSGPRILAANMAVSVPGGHMAGSLAYEAQSAEHARELVAHIAEDGKPDLIKLMITGGVLDATVKGEPGVLKMPAEYVKAACDEAHKRGLKVAAHVESPEGVRVALENGVDTIEHGATPDQAILELFKERGTALVATLSPALPYALFDRAVSGASEMEQYNGRVVFDGIIDCAKKCLDAGIPVGLGTDTGCDYVTHYNMWMELALFHTYCGVSPAFAIHTATKLNAEIAGLGGVTGFIAPGYDADLIAVEQNPLEDLAALSAVKLVMSRGRLTEHPRVKKYPLVEERMVPFVRG